MKNKIHISPKKNDPAIHWIRKMERKRREAKQEIEAEQRMFNKMRRLSCSSF